MPYCCTQFVVSQSTNEYQNISMPLISMVLNIVKLLINLKVWHKDFYSLPQQFMIHCWWTQKYDIQILIFLQHNICCISGLHCKLPEEMLYVKRALCKIASRNIFIICEMVVLTWSYFPTDTHSRNWSLYCHILWSSGAWDSNDAVPWKTTQWTLMLDCCCDVINAERHADAVFFLF